MKTGDIVKYSKPIDADEASYRFLIVEHNKDRAFIQSVDDDETITPTELVAISDIELAQ